MHPVAWFILALISVAVIILTVFLGLALTSYLEALLRLRIKEREQELRLQKRIMQELDD